MIGHQGLTQKSSLTDLANNSSIRILNLYPPRGGGCTTYISGTGTCHRKGIYFPDIGIKNDINLHNFGIRNGIYLFARFLYEIHKVRYNFSKNWYRVRYTFSKKWHKERVWF